MSKGLSIVLTAHPKGVFLEGVIDSTPYPGYCMQIKPAVAPISGRHTWQARNTTAGSKGQMTILREDDLQGFLGMGAYSSFGPRLKGTAYVSGTRGFLYDPIAGDEMNIYIKDQAGTSDSVAIGDLFGASNDGTFHANSSYTSAPMQSMEVVTWPTADYLLWVTYLGNNA
jgi:hypothetical protein